ncbi:MAG: thioredoxin fold domain-containing protein [Deltaproteobacteria bacterium]|nr:thioredoxin fold domain-containing protein [Deltaproteobacteria bacterium]
MEFTRTCPACGAPNRVPARHLAHRGRCGSCRAALPPHQQPVDVDERAFDEVVGQVKEPVLVDFYADWCAPCRVAAPHVLEVARDLAGQVVVLKVNTDRNPGLARRYDVQGIPNFVVIHGGRTVVQKAGVVRADEMTAWLN